MKSEIEVDAMEVYGWIIEHVDILGLIIDFLAFIVTAMLTIVIYSLERKHEKNHEKAEEEAKKMAIAEAAKVFLIDNDEEIEYLPLAEIAAKLRLKRKHSRRVTTKFLRCNEQLQQEIILQANTPVIQMSMDDVQTALENLQNDLDKHGFGRKILYDRAKYLHRAFERWSDILVEDVNPYMFEDLRIRECHDKQSGMLWRVTDHNTTLFSYMWNYLHKEEIGIDGDEVQPPIDMVFQKCNLGTCEESIMTFWTMRIIIDACHAIGDIQGKDVFEEVLIQTQEDMYYYTLAVLCETYTVGGRKV